VCLSDAVYREVEGKIDAVFVEVGIQKLRSVEQPIKVWRLRTGVETPD
jgi:class 3 adenylate cyclase